MIDCGRISGLSKKHKLPTEQYHTFGYCPDIRNGCIEEREEE